MNQGRQGLFTLDVLPPQASIECQQVLGFDDEVRVIQLRFRATRRRGRLRRQQKSEWSGWFAYKGEPIELRWDVFWL